MYYCVCILILLMPFAQLRLHTSLLLLLPALFSRLGLLAAAYDPIEDSPFAPPYRAGCNASECDTGAPALLPKGYVVERRGASRRLVMLRGQAEDAVSAPVSAPVSAATAAARISTALL